MQWQTRGKAKPHLQIDREESITLSLTESPEVKENDWS